MKSAVNIIMKFCYIIIICVIMCATASIGVPPGCTRERVGGMTFTWELWLSG